ncbi:hypothetical protein BASA81_007760 [Batrachochytrium salamandrivorans]|nr:hypothetical protein BASA81_007760 [Batrachochytrium salamandrivorans]
MSAKWKQPDTDTTVLYQFKTYINAPAVDKRVFATLKANKWDVVWLESGEWGSWGTPHERERTTYQESLDFLRKAARAFPGWIVVSGNSAYTEQNLLFLAAARSMAERHGDRILVFDQKPIVQAADRKNIVQGHGYYGAATDVMVRVFLALVCDEGGWERE